MPKIKVRPRVILALMLCALSGGVMADEDWLIARVNGQWTWERTGAQGRVLKSFLNQEVLRLEEDGQVTAVSALPIAAGESVKCSETARHNAKHACSSAFLECRTESASGFSVLLGLMVDDSKGASDARNAYSCVLNPDRVTEAAHAVGLIESLASKKPAKVIEPAATSLPDTGR